MKTTEQNTKEVMTYLEKSSQHFFASEDGQHWQAIVKMHKSGEYVFAIDGEAFPINLENYIKDGVTAGKTFLKQKYHPAWDVPRGKYWYGKDCGHGPSKKIKAVRWNRERLQLTATAVQNL